MTPSIDIEDMTQEQPLTSAAECEERIHVLQADNEAISAEIDAARLRYDCGEEIDWNWFHRANSARAYKKKEIATLRRLRDEMQKQERQAAGAAHDERVKQAAEAKARRKADRAALGNAEQRAKLQAVLDHLRAKHPAIMPEVWAIIHHVEQQMGTAA